MTIKLFCSKFNLNFKVYLYVRQNIDLLALIFSNFSTLCC